MNDPLLAYNNINRDRQSIRFRKMKNDKNTIIVLEKVLCLDEKL